MGNFSRLASPLRGSARREPDPTVQRFPETEGEIKKSLEYGSLKKKNIKIRILFMEFCCFSRFYKDTFRIQGILMKLGTQEVKKDHIGTLFCPVRFHGCLLLSSL